MKNLFLILLKVILVIVITSKCSGEISHNKCYRCLKEFDVCQTIEDDVLIESNETLICKDKLGCISDYSMPSMHPDRTSSCYPNQGKYGDRCQIGNQGFCGYQMICDFPFNISSPPMCVGFKTLQPGEKCISDSECDSLKCDKEKLICIENQHSCNPNTYWSGTTCVNILNTGDNCTSDSQCSIFDTCNNGICIEKYSLNENSSCVSDYVCDISNSLTCTEGKCQVLKKSNTTNCQVDGCLAGYEYCNCDSGECEQSKLFNSECKNIQYQLDACVYGRCVYTGGYISINSCVMKNCGSLVCEYHSKCTNGPCDNNNSSFCISNTNTPNNNTLPNNPTNSSESIDNSSSSNISSNSDGTIDSSSTNGDGTIDSGSSNPTNSSESIGNSSSSTNSNGTIGGSSLNPVNSSESIGDNSSSSTNGNGTIDGSSLNPTDGGGSIGDNSSSSTNSDETIDSSSSTNGSVSMGNSSSSSTNSNGTIDSSSSNSINSNENIGNSSNSTNSNETIGNSSSNSTLGSKEENSLNPGNSGSLNSTESDPKGSSPNTTNNNGTKNNSLNSTSSNGYYHGGNEVYLNQNSSNSSRYSFSSLLILLLPMLLLLISN
ncbi:hypothetical protein ACTA71_000738 [Dictyostelium dimigraforme]